MAKTLTFEIPADEAMEFEASLVSLTEHLHKVNEQMASDRLEITRLKAESRDLSSQAKISADRSRRLASDIQAIATDSRELGAQTGRLAEESRRLRTETRQMAESARSTASQTELSLAQLEALL